MMKKIFSNNKTVLLNKPRTILISEEYKTVPKILEMETVLETLLVDMLK
jgi:hypothetical protein